MKRKGLILVLIAIRFMMGEASAEVAVEQKTIENSEIQEETEEIEEAENSEEEMFESFMGTVDKETVNEIESLTCFFST